MYKPIGWKNRAVEYARRYEMTQGERSGLVYLKPAPGEVDNQGTPVNAENLNHMDEGILNLDQNKVNATDGDVSDTVATFDQNPTTAPENIASGDRLGTLFGKIYNVIKDFFSHKSDKEIHTTRAEKNSWNNSLSDAKTYADAMYSQLTGYTDKKVADLIGGAPETLDTIEEVATAIKENENVVKALDAAIGKKANQNELDTHISNDSIHVDAAKQAKWDGYEQRITDINNNLNISSLEMGTATTSTEGQATIYYSKTHDRPADIIIATALSAHNAVRIVQITGSYNNRFLAECWNDSFKDFVNCTFSYLAIWNKA